MKNDILSTDPDALRRLENELARHVGLRASVVLRRALRTATTLPALVNHLAESLTDPRQRADFLARAAPDSNTSNNQGRSRWRHNIADREIIERQLTLRLGPLAGVLVRQTAEQTPILRDLFEELAAHIDDQTERKRFMRDAIAEIRLKNSRSPS